ncbi:MAG: radical SAM protein [Treponema sp.]|jgi:nitrogen fixation protein NifB|nr:radical SAM protein [Treponema sp.]
MACLGLARIDERFTHISSRHPCFSGEANMAHGRLHLPVSPVCNIQCRFCKRTFNKAEQRPGVSAVLLKPEDAADLVRKALKLCPEITVAGIAGPGDTLATDHALETFRIIHREFPNLINCLSTNGLLLERYADDLYEAGVGTLTVTVNAVDPVILDKICSHIVLDGKKYTGVAGAGILIEAQKRGIRKAADLGLLIKINIVLIPALNGDHIREIARTVSELGAGIINIIPLIPQHEFAEAEEPSCEELNEAREAAEEFLPVFRHCQHCRADACGIPGKGDFSSLLYSESREFEQTFSHG